MNESGKRKVPDNSPVDFISKRWKNHILENDGSINRHYYEMAVLTELRDRVKAGDISISGSKQYKDFEDYLLSKNEWISSKENYKLPVSLSFDEYIQDRLNNLNERLKWLSKNIKNDISSKLILYIFSIHPIVYIYISIIYLHVLYDEK